MQIGDEKSMDKAKSEKNSTLKLIAGFFAFVMLIQGAIYVLSANSHEMFRQINSEAEQNLYNSAVKQSVLLKNKLHEFSDTAKLKHRSFPLSRCQDSKSWGT